MLTLLLGIWQGFRFGRVTALQKPDGGIRGIIVGDIIRRLIAPHNCPADLQTKRRRQQPRISMLCRRNQDGADVDTIESADRGVRGWSRRIRLGVTKRHVARVGHHVWRRASPPIRLTLLF